MLYWLLLTEIIKICSVWIYVRFKDHHIEKVYVCLKKYLLGSEELHYSNDNLLDSIVSFELYFRSNSSETVFIDNLELSNYPYEINYIDKEKTEKIDESIIIMKGN